MAKNTSIVLMTSEHLSKLFTNECAWKRNASSLSDLAEAEVKSVQSQEGGEEVCQAARHLIKLLAP